MDKTECPMDTLQQQHRKEAQNGEKSYFTEQSYSWEADGSLSGQYIFLLLWNTKLHYRFHKA